MDQLFNLPLSEIDPLIADAIDNEVARQANGLELIASENFISEAGIELLSRATRRRDSRDRAGRNRVSRSTLRTQ